MPRHEAGFTLTEITTGTHGDVRPQGCSSAPGPSCVVATLTCGRALQCCAPFAQRSSGFTLLEVLISIIVLSLGVLGALGLQAAALKSNQEARYQADAVRLGSDLSELMSSNPAVASNTTAANNPYLITCSAASSATASTSGCPDATTPNSLSATTTDSATATNDIATWYRRLDAALPGRRVAVCFDQTPYDASGLPQWTCSNSGTVPVIKIGWTRQALKAGGTPDQATRPGVVLTVGVCNPLVAEGTPCVS